VVYTCNPNTQKTEAGGPRVQSQLGLDRKNLSKKTIQNNNNNNDNKNMIQELGA
jgi:hypothetical protein